MQPRSKCIDGMGEFVYYTIMHTRSITAQDTTLAEMQHRIAAAHLICAGQEVVQVRPCQLRRNSRNKQTRNPHAAALCA